MKYQRPLYTAQSTAFVAANKVENPINRLTTASRVILTLMACCTANPIVAQEWTKADSGRAEYVQDRVLCAQQSQQMALEGDELQKDIRSCLVGKGWQWNQAVEVRSLYCEDKQIWRACKNGGNAEIYGKDRAECWDQTLRSIGNTYSRPGGWGLMGVIVASAQAEQNRKALEQSQISTMRMCLEGRAWTIEMKEVPKAPAPAPANNNITR